MRPSPLAALFALLAGLITPSAVHVQSGADASPTPKRETIRGVVFDSLAFEPLASAFVVARPSGSSTTTDSLGRFTLLTEGEVTDLLVYHDALDRIGLGALGATRPDANKPWRDVSLATPSLATLWPMLCDSKRPTGTRSVIITGTARLSDNVTRLSGAKVIVQWIPLLAEEGEAQFRSVETVTDSIGNYAACGVEEFVEPSLIALSDELQSGVITMASDIRPIRRMDLVLANLADDQRASVVRGRVVNSQGGPMRDFAVSIDGREGMVITDPNGAFRLDSVPFGSRMLYARAIGFTPVGQIVDVVEGEIPALTIPVSETIEIEGVQITERLVLRRDRSEFELRRRAGIARYVDSTTIMRASTMRAALQAVPNVEIRPMGNRATTEFEIRGRNGCPAHIYLDGTLSDIETVNVMPRSSIAYVELYSSVAFAPGRFIRVMADDCAVAIFWTKYALRP